MAFERGTSHNRVHIPVDTRGSKHKRRKHWRGPLAGAVLCTLLGLAVLVLPFGESLDHLGYDLTFFARPDVPVEDAVVLYLDDASYQNLQQPYAPGDRGVYAECLTRLKALHARAAVFDILFDMPGTNDAVFVEAAKSFGSVAVAAIRKQRDLGGRAVVWETRPPFDALRAVTVFGMAEESNDSEHIMRQHYRTNDVVPSLASRAVELATKQTPPPSARARWINYYGPPLHLPHYSFFQLISNAVPAAAISNKVVFIGARMEVGTITGKGADDFRTPYSRWTHTRSPGVEITATTFLNLLRGDWLTRVSPGIELLLCLLVGVLFGGGLALCRPLTAIGLGLLGCLFIALSSMWFAWHHHLWFAWLTLMLVQLPVAIAFSVLAHNWRLHFENEVLAATLAATQAARELMPKIPPTPVMPAPGPLQPIPVPGSISSFFNSPGAVPPSGATGTTLEPKLVAIPDHALLRPIGRGAYGEVWLARDILGTFHAVKIVARASFKDPAPFEREFNGLKRFTPISRSHPGFVHILHVGKNDQLGYMYYIMELGDDEQTRQTIVPEKYSPQNLAKRLAGRQRLPLPEILELGTHLADALNHLHLHQLIHRDIKPANIIFKNGSPKFADIGLVTDIASNGRDVTLVGTPAYLPPEGPGTAAADIYSLGKVLYEASMGLDPGQFPDLPTCLLDGSGDEGLFQLNTIIVKACEPDPTRRYQSAAELAQDLAALRKSHPSGQIA